MMYLSAIEVYENGKLVSNNIEEHDSEDAAVDNMLTAYNCAIKPDMVKEDDTWGQKDERYCWKKSGSTLTVWTTATIEEF